MLKFELDAVEPIGLKTLTTEDHTLAMDLESANLGLSQLMGELQSVNKTQVVLAGIIKQVETAKDVYSIESLFTVGQSLLNDYDLTLRMPATEAAYTDLEQHREMALESIREAAFAIPKVVVKIVKAILKLIDNLKRTFRKSNKQFAEIFKNNTKHMNELIKLEADGKVEFKDVIVPIPNFYKGYLGMLPQVHLKLIEGAAVLYALGDLTDLMDEFNYKASIDAFAGMYTNDILALVDDVVLADAVGNSDDLMEQHRMLCVKALEDYTRALGFDEVNFDKIEKDTNFTLTKRQRYLSKREHYVHSNTRNLEDMPASMKVVAGTDPEIDPNITRINIRVDADDVLEFFTLGGKIADIGDRAVDGLDFYKWFEKSIAKTIKLFDKETNNAKAATSILKVINYLLTAVQTIHIPIVNDINGIYETLAGINNVTEAYIKSVDWVE